MQSQFKKHTKLFHRYQQTDSKIHTERQKLRIANIQWRTKLEELNYPISRFTVKLHKSKQHDNGERTH